MSCVAPRLFRHRHIQQYWVASCQRWACAACTRQVSHRWRRILTWASANGPAPQYLITLTVREPLSLWRTAPPNEQAELREQAVALTYNLTRALSRLVEEVREKYGSFEYLAVVELTTGRRTPGHRPHLHLLVRGPAMSRRWLSARWAFHSRGSFRVDIQRPRSPALAGDYLVGYTVGRHKKAQQQYLTHWPGPRIRYSRGFFLLPVKQIRALLWPPAEPGVWEYIGILPYRVQITWELLVSDAVSEPPEAATG